MLEESYEGLKAVADNPELLKAGLQKVEDDLAGKNGEAQQMLAWDNLNQSLKTAAITLPVGGGLAGSAKTLDNVGDVVNQLSDDVIKSTSDVWELKVTDRGTAIESYLAETEYSSDSGWYNVGKERNGYFPLVDFQNGNTLVSLKSVDTNGSTWLLRMQTHITKLGTNGAKVNDAPANMVLNLRVEPGGASAAQTLIQYGRDYNVTVIIKEFE